MMSRDPSPPFDPVTGPVLDTALAERLRRASGAARELSDVLWEALHEELRERSGAGPRALHVTELSGRLVDVAATLSALATVGDRTLASAAASEGAVVPAEVVEPEAPGPQFAHESRFERASGDSSSVVIIVDERDDPPTAESSTVTAEESETLRTRARVRPRPLPWDTPLSEELRATRSGERQVSGAAGERRGR